MGATDRLIDELAANLEPQPPGAPAKRLALGAAAGTAASALLSLPWLGTPLAEVPVTGVAAFAMKSLYGVALAAASFGLLAILGRPGRRPRLAWLWLLIPPAFVGVSALVELAAVGGYRASLAVLGSTWNRCLIAIGALSLPVLAGTIWGMRALAPTRLRLAGLVAGLAAGATAATLYALYCPEITASFLLTWYSLGILAAGLFGTLSAPRALRW